MLMESLGISPFVIIEDSPTINPLVLIVGAIILVIAVFIIGDRNGERGLRYWMISAIRIVIVYIVWQVLSIFVWGTIITYSGDPRRVFYSNVVNTLVYFGLALLVVFTEMRRSQSRLDND